MISFPNAKINLGLNIISKREDGFHDIETCMYPVPLRDVLEICPADHDTFYQSGTVLDSSEENNLCIKARNILKNDHDIPPLSIHLHKIVPHGAGLGGGSADAVNTLLIINEISDLGLNNDQLREKAARIGSDCAFFVSNKAAISSGKGEILREINFSLKGKHIVIVHPGFSISTPFAYSMVTPKKPDKSIEDILDGPRENWKNELKNDFQEILEEKFPQLKSIRQILYSNGAFFAGMSGSGSAYFGIFNEAVEAPESWFDPKYFVFQSDLD